MGISWGFGAISTAEWEGVYLRDIIKKKLTISKKSEDFNKIKHVRVYGVDGFYISIPIEKAMSNYGDVMLAYKMNGEELPRDHGFPLRLIVPGYVGVRNIKWVKSIELHEEDAPSEWQRGISYK